MLKYNAPINGDKSSIDGADSDQMQTFLWLKKAIITQAKEQYFTPLADVTTMPKYFGKTMKLYEYVPLLDDRNVNDQGIDANGATIKNGNLYGSSKDIGTITDAMPTLTEEGGRRNRVGFTRLTRSGSLHKFGLFTEFTQEALDFDSDGADLMDHISNELTKGAVQFTEDKIQSDLLAAAGTVLYSGAAIGDAEITGEVTPKTDTTPEIPASIVTQDDLVKLDQILNDNDTPRQTTIITGTQKVDTVTLPSCRIMYVGSELVPLLKRMRNYFDEPLWVPVQKYAAGTTVLNGEVGSIGDFRVVSVPRMLSWKGKGAKVANNAGYRSSMVNGEEHYDIFPMLVVGDDSFTTIGYQSDGKMIKMSVLTTMPNERGSYNDPYAETGRTALKWYYGILIKRPERIGLIKTVAPI